MSIHVICRRVLKQPSRALLLSLMGKYASLRIAIRKEYIYLLFSETADFHMFNSDSHPKELQELNSQPFQVLGNSEELIEQAEACPIQLHSLQDAKQVTITQKGEASPCAQTEQKEEMLPLESVQKGQESATGVQGYWKAGGDSEGLAGQLETKEQINLKQFVALQGQMSEVFELEFNQQSPPNFLGSLQQKEQTAEQTKLQAPVAFEVSQMQRSSQILMSEAGSLGTTSVAVPVVGQLGNQPSASSEIKESEVLGAVVGEVKNSKIELPTLSKISQPSLIAETKGESGTQELQTKALPLKSETKSGQNCRKTGQLPIFSYFIVFVLLAWISFLLILN